MHHKTLSVPNLTQPNNGQSVHRQTAQFSPSSVNAEERDLQNSASSDTLVQDEPIESNEKRIAEEIPDLDPEPTRQMSTFNQGKAKTNGAASPLTPRQIKQRNSAKRNSIPRSNSSNSSIVSSSSSDSSSVSLNGQQQTDLAFLQTQKFDVEFMQTTRELFTHYPNAKISISVTVLSLLGENGQGMATPRQIEIDKPMFEKIVASQAKPQLQPPAPIRTTSTLSSPCSTPPSSASSNYETPAGNDLAEAIKRTAAEHLMKRQANAKQDLANRSTPVKSELEIAIQNRIQRRKSAETETDFVKRQSPPPPPPPMPPFQAPSTVNNFLPPPPSPQALHRLSCSASFPAPSTAPPPAPPPPPPLLAPEAIVQATLKPTKPPKPNLSPALIDPRSSSEFGALIAKKAAEKRAKFQETRPTANAVTFQPDGSKIFTATKNETQIETPPPKLLTPKPSAFVAVGISKKTATITQPIVESSDKFLLPNGTYTFLLVHKKCEMP